MNGKPLPGVIVVLAAVAAFGVVLSMALVIIGQQLSGRPAARWQSAVLVAALTFIPLAALAEAVTR